MLVISFVRYQFCGLVFALALLTTGCSFELSGGRHDHGVLSDHGATDAPSADLDRLDNGLPTMDKIGSTPDEDGGTPDQKVATLDQGPPLTNAFYVSPNGSDSNPGTFSQPFKTLQAARSAMQTSSFKTTYLMGGIHTVSNTLSLGSSDAGESWLGYPGQTPVLDGNGNVNVAIEVRGDTIAIRWLTIQNFTKIGILASGVDGVVIDSNTIQNITSNGWNQAPIEIQGTFSNGKITNNLLQQAGYSGIEVNAFPGDDISNLLIDGNAVYEVCLTVADCGGIYVMDRGHSGATVTISNNVVGNYGTSSTGGRGIYLDDQLSNVTVSGNIVFGTGEWGLQIHGGDHNTFQNNVFDISKAARLGLYQDVSGGPYYGMMDNVFTCNIVWTSETKSGAIWDYINSGGSMALPSVSNNVYWSITGTQLSNSGTIKDSSPVVADPKFVNPAQHDYDFQSSPPLSCFKPIDVSQVGPLPH